MYQKPKLAILLGLFCLLTHFAFCVSSQPLSETQKQMLLDNGAWEAIDDNNYKTIDTFLKLGANPNTADAYGYTLLHKAACLAMPMMISTLLKAGANPTAQDTQGFTPLQRAIKYHAPKEIIDRLIDAMSKKTSRKETHPLNFTVTTNGYTALMLAVLYENLHAVTKLLECPEVDRTIKTVKKDLAAHLAVKQLAQTEENLKKFSEKLDLSPFEIRELSELKKTVETYTQIKALFDKQIVPEKRTYKRKDIAET